MDLENLAKELHGEVKKEKSFDDEDSYTKDSNN
jgi:hypothetical protein